MSTKTILKDILIVLFTLLGGYAVQQAILVRAKPILVQQVIKTDLAGLSLDIRQQITLLPVNYLLQNNSRASAANVTIFVKSDYPLLTGDLKFTQDSEDHQTIPVDLREFKVNVPTIRPGGFEGFQILTPASNNITFTERSDNALFETPNGIGADAAKQKTTLLEWGIGAFALLVWLPVLLILARVFWKAGKSWQEIETGTNHPEFRNRLIILIVTFYIYTDLFLGALGPLGMWLPLPRIQFQELTDAFIFYLLVTRYKLIENWISAMIDKQNANQRNEPPTVP